MFNSFGNIFRLTSFGESHGKGVGGVIDGFPSGITIDEEFVQQELNRRRPGPPHVRRLIKSSSFPAFLKENQPDVPSVSSYGMKINIPTTIII